MRVWMDGRRVTPEEAVASLRAAGCSEPAIRAYFSRSQEDWEPHIIGKGPRQGTAVERNSKTGSLRDLVADQNPAPSPDAQPPSSRTPEDPVWRSLQMSPVASVLELVTESRNQVHVVTLADGTLGVFKPEAGEYQNLRNNVAGRYYVREAAASKLASVLGLGHMVPPTVIRDIAGQPGSLQHYIEDAALADELRGRPDQFGRDAHQLALAACFDHLIGNSDRHSANWMVGRQAGQIRLIDNGLSFPDDRHSGIQDRWIIDEAGKRNLPIPPEAKDWLNRWPEIEPVLRDHGLNDKEVAGVRERAAQLTAASDFLGLPAAGNHYARLPRTTPWPAPARRPNLLGRIMGWF